MSEPLSLSEIKRIGSTPKKEIAHKLGFFYRLFTPYCSYLIINFTKIGPTFFSILALIVPIIGSTLFISSDPKTIVVGALLHQLGYFFDVLDGEIARLRGQDSIQGSYIDAVNHFFNIPYMFVGLALGAYFANGKLWLIATVIVLAIFSRGSGKYCMFYCIGRKREYARKGHETDEPQQAPAQSMPEESTLINALKAPWVYPNTTVIILIASFINLKWASFTLCGYTVSTIEALAYFYALTYFLLDIIECVRIYKTQKTKKMYHFLFDK